METKIIGETLPAVICKLKKGEAIVTENGGMSWMDEGIEMKTTTNGGIMNEYTAKKDDVEIGFSSCFPGKILEYDLEEGATIIAQKRAFLCSQNTVDISIKFRKKLGAGFFGGEGFIMQKFTGPGKVFLEIDGTVVRKELQAGEKLKVDNGYVAAMTENVKLDIETVKGVKNIVFGGEGLFLTTVEGPGTVWLQTMPISKLSNTLMLGRAK